MRQRYKIGKITDAVKREQRAGDHSQSQQRADQPHHPLRNAIGVAARRLRRLRRFCTRLPHRTLRAFFGGELAALCRACAGLLFFCLGLCTGDHRRRRRGRAAADRADRLLCGILHSAIFTDPQIHQKTSNFTYGRESSEKTPAEYGSLNNTFLTIPQNSPYSKWMSQYIVLQFS